MTYRSRSHTLTITVLSLLITLPLTGCLLVGGYSSRGGWFIWPGSFSFILVLLILFFLLRSRR